MAILSSNLSSVNENSRAAELDRIAPSLPISESFFEDGGDQIVYGYIIVGEDHRVTIF